MAVIADRCPQVQVTVVDLNQGRIDAWNDPDLSRLPVYEPGLDTVVGRARGRNLSFSTAVEAAIADADMVFISVNTPTKTKGLGAARPAICNGWRPAHRARRPRPHNRGEEHLPVRTAAAIKPSWKQRVKVMISTRSRCCPIRVFGEGTAIRDLEAPDRKISDDSPPLMPRADLCPLGSEAVNPVHQLLEQRALQAHRQCFLPSGSARSTRLPPSVKPVGQMPAARAIGTDSCIGPKFLNAGRFRWQLFSEGHLNLVYLCRHFGLPEVADYWESVVALNTWQQHRISRLVVQKLFGTLTGKRLAILGFAFKADTNDTREARRFASAAIF